MPRFFSENIISGVAIIKDLDASHIAKSLRMKIGDEITICDMQGTDYECVIESLSDEIKCNVISSHKSDTEPSVKVTLYQAMPKLDKLEMIIQKAVELGVNEIVPVLTKRCISRPDDKAMKKKLQRYQKIALEAAKQSGRGIIPNVTNIIHFKEAISRMKLDDLSLICYEGGGKKLSEMELSKMKTISIIIGGEGGFDIEEVETAVVNGINRIGLGPRILRCETAPLAALSIIMNLTENM